MTDRRIRKEKAEITGIEEIAPDIVSMTFGTGLGESSVPGQFVLLYPRDRSMLLGRPVCIASAGDENLRIVFRISGKGTREIAGYKKGDTVYMEGPLGSGYPLPKDMDKGKRAVLLGGGVGAPSLLYLADTLRSRDKNADVLAVLGYRSRKQRHFLSNDMKDTGAKVLISTDDGSEGIRGNVIDALESGISDPLTGGSDIIYACGPMPMLSAVKRYAERKGVMAYISLEEHMACGVGACLGCVVRTSEKDGHSMVKNARICTEGPVFDARTVDI